MMNKVVQILTAHGFNDGDYKFGSFGFKTKTIFLKTAPPDALVSDLKAQFPDWTFIFQLMGSSQ